MSELSELRVEQGGSILLAIPPIKSNEISRIKKAAQAFDIFLSASRGSQKEGSFKGDSRINSYRLTTSKKKLPKQWILP